MLKITINKLEGQELKTPMTLNCPVQISLSKEKKGGFVAVLLQYKSEDDMRGASKDYADIKKTAFRFDALSIANPDKNLNLGTTIVEMIEKKLVKEIEALESPSVIKIEVV